MAETVAQMTPLELRELIATYVEEAVDRPLDEILGDPDAGLEVREELVQRLRQQQQQVAAGDVGRPLNDVARELGLQ